MIKTEGVVIVGGGPAGAYCAFKLASQGIYPIIFDHSHPREKPCGGGISPYLINKFPFVENFRSKGFTFGNFKIISCVNTEVTTKGLENGFSISRRYFDQGLLEMAIQKGAKLIKEKVIDVRKKGNIWNIKGSGTSLSANILVGADGVNSIVRRKIIGPISRENLALTYGYLTTSLKKEDATIKLLAEVPGCIWVFPGNNYSNIGIGSELKYGNMLKGLLETFINSHFPQTKKVSRYAAMLPSASDPKFFDIPCAGSNWILIGDAAGHVDPISGGGILYALGGGKIAAQTIENNNIKSFNTKWNDEYGNFLKERCIHKTDFYDPLKSTISMLIGIINKTYFWPNAQV